MENPGATKWRSDPSEKHANDYYYRYKRGIDQKEGGHISIPNKSPQERKSDLD